MVAMTSMGPDLHLNIWLLGALVLTVAIAPCAYIGIRGRSRADRLVALSMATTLSILTLMLMAQGTARPSFIDLALALLIVSFPGTLTYCRFLELGL